MKMLLGLILLPLCAAVTRTLVFLLRSVPPAADSELLLGAWALLIGFVMWLVIYCSMTRPIRTYVLAHELTHALWGFLMGSSVRKLRVSSRGGSVTLSRSNFLIALAPYFFPFYTVLVLLLFGTLALFFDLRPYETLWLGLVGLTYGFHVTFTVTMLMQRQTDVLAHGRLFSYALIFLLNALGICLWIVAVSRPSMGEFLTRLAQDCAWVWEACRHLGPRLPRGPAVPQVG